MPFHGAGADVQLRADLRVGATVAGQCRDLLFLGRELIAGVVSALAHLLASGQQLASRALCEAIRSHRGENVMCLAELFAGIDPPVLTAEPLALAVPGTGGVLPQPGKPPRRAR